MSPFQLPTINFSGIQVRFRLWDRDSQRWRGDGEWRRWLGINLGNFPQFFCPLCWRLIQSVEIPRAWLIEILIMHHHHCEIGHNIKLLWHPLTASWISESCLGEVWKKGNWIIKSIRRNKSSTWAAGKYVPQISPDSWKVLTSNFCWKFLISTFFLASASCGAKNRQGNTRPTAAKRVTKPGQKHQVRTYCCGTYESDT